ncbi:MULTISPECIES: HNH endonuclease [Massilia]|uniref:HNH endonuclease n=2 Tax=Massilia TaxID=149698 RepID=A0ABX0LS87_9BURK|nr:MULTISPECIES: HNH endonuclease [Massilia]NHZ34747.1 HNH endonuclease [Massilia rubra]NHZ66949.1 HNH endonuclease [Massilia genomosp. 1]NHZ97172.1 HNH endonuclease [Massilia sp. CCM 8734]
MTPQILALDIAGNPFGWISAQEAIHYYAVGKVAWELGDREFLFRGGVSNAGVLSTMTVKPIISIMGSERMTKKLRVALPLGDDNQLLFARDRHTCAYCGNVFARQHLSRDHILARTHGGKDSWTNCVTACKPCNQAKGATMVHDFHPLLYVPYVPCRFEHFILSGRNVLADQHDYLSAKLPKHSRMLA